MTVISTRRSLMVPKIKKMIASFVLALSLIACSPHASFATAGPGKIEDADHYDARVQGYEPDVELAAGSSGGCWFLLICMSVVCVSVIFKDAKRSHLD